MPQTSLHPFRAAGRSAIDRDRAMPPSARRRRGLTPVITALTLLLFATTPATAQSGGTSIFVDVSHPSSQHGTPGPGFAGAAPFPGAWNRLDVHAVIGTTTTTPPLFDTGGTPTGVVLEWTTQGTNLDGFTFDSPLTSGDDEALLDDYGYARGPSSLTFHGLPPATYDVIVYALAVDGSTFVTSVATRGSQDPLQLVSGTFTIGYALRVTHSRHTVDVASGAPLVIDLDVVVSFDTLAGVQVFPSQGSLQQGTPYCAPAVLHSGGIPAQLSLTGSDVVANNDATLRAGPLPYEVFGFFLVSRNQVVITNPGGSQGTLCIGLPLGKFVGPGRILSSGPAGSIAIPVDLTALPQPTGPIAVLPGDVWNFQAWFRDSSGGAPTSNLTHALEVAFR